MCSGFDAARRPGMAICVGRLAMPDGGFDPVRLAPAVARSDYTVKKDGVSLAVYRKRSGEGPKPVLFLVHGSSNSGLSSFDLTAPGGEYSTMNVFAELGYDVW